jgi:hypothetical protein
MRILFGFIAGFLATLIFHQVVVALLWWAGVAPFGPFSMAATQPFGVPAVISLAFWGGVWGIVLWALIRTSRGGAYWAKAFVIGALGPSVVAWFVVMPIKSMGFAGGWDPKIIVGALLLNGAWGLGVALLMRLANPSQSL